MFDFSVRIRLLAVFVIVRGADFCHLSPRSRGSGATGKIFSKIFENPVRIRPLAALVIVEG
jgi:hypothetical protein